MDAAIETTNLSCRYGRTEAVRDLTLAVRPGSVFALLGPNGAGKTTTMRVLMNMLRPASGRARVLGIDSRVLGPREFERIGYVSENQKLPDWMSLGELLSFCRPLYRTWDDALARKLIQDFGLSTDRRLSHLSRGMRVKAALISALAFRPRVLLLDEPFSGLDPVVRDDLVHGVLQLAGEEQWTVLLSSHDLDEVERLVDDVGFMDGGRLVLQESMSGIQQRFRRVEVTLADGGQPQAGPPQEGPPKGGHHVLPETWIGTALSGRVVRFVETRYNGEATERQILKLFPDARVEAHQMTLREIFVALARHERSRGQEASR